MPKQQPKKQHRRLRFSLLQLLSSFVVLILLNVATTTVVTGFVSNPKLAHRRVLSAPGLITTSGPDDRLKWILRCSKNHHHHHASSRFSDILSQTSNSNDNATNNRFKKIQKICQKFALQKKKILWSSMLAFSLFFQVSVGGGVGGVDVGGSHRSRSSTVHTETAATMSTNTNINMAATTKYSKAVSANRRSSTTFHSNSVAKKKLSMTGGAAAASASRVSTSSDNEVTSALDELMLFLRSGGKADILILLMATALIPSICKNWLKMSPILGFLAAGTLLGPNMLNVIGDTHTGE